MPNAKRRFWRLQSSVYSRFELGKDFAERDLFPLCIFRTQVVQIGSNKPPI
jgi:hypothetical protein